LAGGFGAAAVAAEQSPWNLEAGVVHQPSVSIDGGGEVDSVRIYAELGRTWSVGPQSRLGVSLGYGEQHYDFSGAGFASPDPWGRVRELRLGAQYIQRTDSPWSLFAFPSLRFSAEQGAALDDGVTVGLLAGGTYRFSENLSIGPGVGVFSEIEDDVSLFPVLLLDWAITDRLSLESGRGFAASRGPGLQLRWRQSSTWDFALGGRYEKVRFRLDDDGPAADGVGEDESLPIFAVARYHASRDSSVSLLVGARAAATLRLENSRGDPVREVDADTGAFYGLTFSTRLP
jgi:hypothetical protein